MLNIENILGQYLYGELMDTIKGHYGEEVRKLVSVDETHLAVAFTSHTEKHGKAIRIFNWKIESGAEFGLLTGHTADVWSLVNLDDNNLVASGSLDTTIKIWHWKGVQLVRNLTGHTSVVTGLVRALNDSTLLISCSTDETIRLWNRSNGIVLKKFGGYYFSAIIWLDRNQLASCGQNKTEIQIWNVSHGQIVRTLWGHAKYVTTLMSLDNKSLMASGSDDFKIKIWNIDSAREMKTLLGHGGSVVALSLLKNGYLASASMDKSFRIWNWQTECLLKTVFVQLDNRWYHYYVASLLSLPDGNLASGCTDSDIQIWNFQTSPHLSGY
jgi:WD40 repeat protein